MSQQPDINLHQVKNENQIYERTVDLGQISFKELLGLFVTKYPSKNLFTKIESTPVDLSYEDGMLKFRKIKQTIMKKKIYSQEFYEIDYVNKQVNYQEEGLLKEQGKVEQQCIQKQQDNKYNSKFIQSKVSSWFFFTMTKVVDTQRKNWLQQRITYQENIEDLQNYIWPQIQIIYHTKMQFENQQNLNINGKNH